MLDLIYTDTFFLWFNWGLEFKFGTWSLKCKNDRVKGTFSSQTLFSSQLHLNEDYCLVQGYFKPAYIK